LYLTGNTLRLHYRAQLVNAGFEVFTAVTIENAVCWNVMPCGSCKNNISEEQKFLQEPHVIKSQKTVFFNNINHYRLTVMWHPVAS
jgi:cytidine deaminase